MCSSIIISIVIGSEYNDARRGTRNGIDIHRNNARRGKVVIIAATCYALRATCYVLKERDTAAGCDWNGRILHLTMPYHRSPRGYVRQYHSSVSFVLDVDGVLNETRSTDISIRIRRIHTKIQIGTSVAILLNSYACCC